MASKYKCSRPFNSQWVCNYPQFDDLLEELFTDVKSDLGYKKEPTARKIEEAKKHLSSIILDLFRARQSDKILYLGVSKSSNDFSVSSRYQTQCYSETTQ